MAESPARPLIIAHRAGNDLTRLRAALAAGVDYAEADVWLHRGRLEVRHDKTAWPLPLLWDRWSLKRGWPRRLLLTDLLAAVGRGRLFLDLKGSAPGLADALAEAIERAKAQDRTAVSGGWHHLDRLAELLPRLPRFYTIGDARRLAALRPRERHEIAAVSIDSRFLTERIVSELKQAGVESVVAWAVETPAEARRLLAWGVDGITSGNLTLLTAIRDGAAAAVGRHRPDRRSGRDKA